MSESLRVLSIGAGYFARFHLEAWHRIPEATVVAIADPDTEKAREAVQATMPDGAMPALGEDPATQMA